MKKLALLLSMFVVVSANAANLPAAGKAEAAANKSNAMIVAAADAKSEDKNKDKAKDKKKDDDKKDDKKKSDKK